MSGRRENGRNSGIDGNNPGKRARWVGRNMVIAALIGAVSLQPLVGAPTSFAAESALSSTSVTERAPGIAVANGAMIDTAVVNGGAATHGASEVMAAATAAATTAAAPVIRLVSEEPITSGATLRKYVWQTVRNGKEVSSNANVIVVDLHNPYVKLDVITGTGGKFTEKASALEMAKGAGAIAGVNGDFYNTQAEGVPIGAQISDGQWMATPPYLPGFYTFGITGENVPVVEQFAFEGAIQTQDGATYPLGGINKTYYWYEVGDPVPPTPQSDELQGVHSMTDGLYMYTSAWARTDRANDGKTIPTEVLVQNDIIVEISEKRMLNMTAPEDGYILRAAGKAAEFVMQHMQVGDQLTADYTMLPLDPSKQYDVSDFKMMIGGNTIMVDEGKPANFSRKDSDPNGSRARTGVGHSQDGRRAFLITVDSAVNSVGMTMREFQQFMADVGVWRGINLDGGGSTQMVARPLGAVDPIIANNTEYGVQRKVVNGLGVFSTAPQGELQDFLVSGPAVVFLNEEVAYQTKAYDTYLNPLDVSDPIDFPLEWGAPEEAGTFEGNAFTATAPGMTQIHVRLGKVQKDYPIEVVGREMIAEMRMSVPSDYALTEGISYKLPSVLVTTRTGKQRYLPAALTEWELEGIEGTIEDGMLHVAKLTGAGMGRIYANYDGYSAMLTLPLGKNTLWQDFQPANIHYAINFDKYPLEVTGAVRIIKGEAAGLDEGNQAIEMSYDLTGGMGTKAAYINLRPEDKAIAVPGEPANMQLKVRGDGSLNWLRAEVVDAKGTLHRIDLTKTINWTGWKTIGVSLAEYNLAYPISLKRIYVANPEQGQDEREMIGAIAIDDIYFQYKQKLPQLEKVTMQLTLNKKDYTVNGEKRTLDPAPFAIDGSSLIPVHFIIEAMGGNVAWEAAERKVTIVRGTNRIEMWIDNPELVIDGKRVTAPVAPLIKNSRTLIPLKILSESLGWKVTWGEKDQSIRLE